jgi:hypothetical protein
LVSGICTSRVSKHSYQRRLRNQFVQQSQSLPIRFPVEEIHARDVAAGPGNASVRADMIFGKDWRGLTPRQITALLGAQAM